MTQLKLVFEGSRMDWEAEALEPLMERVVAGKDLFEHVIGLLKSSCKSSKVFYAFARAAWNRVG